MSAGARIYNLFPLLFGPVRRWIEQLPRISAMGFDWVYLNPFHAPGATGDLYAAKDHERLHPLFRGSDLRPDDQLIGDFVREANAHGLRVMMDLVVTQLAREAPLVTRHPGWFARDAVGALRRSRGSDDADAPTAAHDLAFFDYAAAEARRGQSAYWADYLYRHIQLGIEGFRCARACEAPVDLWQGLIDTARSFASSAVFVADTAGAGLPEIRALQPAGFDYVLSAAKWWDFRSDWLLAQQEQLRQVAATISFPESYETPRLAAELGPMELEQVTGQARLRYLFAATFSSGVMLPAGYEYGFVKPLDPARTRPEAWEQPRYDLSAFIRAVNALKTASSVLAEEGPQRRITAPRAPVIGLFRETADHSGCALTLINPDPRGPHAIDPGPLLAATGAVYAGLRDVTPERKPIELTPGAPLGLGPLEARILVAERAATGPRESLPIPETETEARLRALADQRVTIEAVYPEVDGGRHPVKRCVGDVLEVWADIFCDGHEQIAAVVKHREAGETAWRDAPMTHFDNDRWTARLPLTRCTRLTYTIEAWRDLFSTWRADFLKKRDAGQDVALELHEGRDLLRQSIESAPAEVSDILQSLAQRLEVAGGSAQRASEVLLSDEVTRLMARFGPRGNATVYRNALDVVVDRTAARFSAWYELFPRSMSGDARRHGTFDDVIARLPYVRDLGFDVLYFPPIHPIGRKNRKGRNNTLTPGPNDVGSPYAIGGAEGGHTAIHPALGTLDDFRRLVDQARRHGLEIALDFAIQCSPDHPWIQQHPEWFDWRPDGTIKYAENPPKKYEDIVNVKFYGAALPEAWYGLRDAVLFWVEQGVRIFRVDNPHTKPFPFWEWMIGEVQGWYPDVLFLSEAFTRPKLMRKLAKLGFTQSYTYFTWRNTKAELTEYLTELTQHESKDFLRPNFFVNTPDINPIPLQAGGRALHQVRAVLAGTLSSVWGMYSGFELCEATPLPGREEYLDSEKYEIRAWDWDRPGNIADTIARLNAIRRDNPALQTLTNLRFYPADDDNILFYGKMTPSGDNIILVAVNLDPKAAHGATIELPWEQMGAGGARYVEAEELLAGGTVRWTGRTQEIVLDPEVNPCAIWRVFVPSEVSTAAAAPRS